MGQVVFSGIQPTGVIHIGNYIGAIRNWVAMQDSYDCLFCVVDYHAITVPYDVDEFAERTLQTVALNIAAGLDPEKSTIFVQSQVPEHTELSWLLTTLTPVGDLERMTQYKEKAGRVGVFAGLMNYPILMAADILIYKAPVVPVGEDQIQHLELARELARRFNRRFGETFPEPQPYITRGARIMALNDPTSKMSKSLPGSYIALTESDEGIRRAIRRAVTDTGPTEDGEMSPGVKNLFTLLEAFAPAEVYESFLKDYHSGQLRYKDLKEALADATIAVIGPIRERHRELMAKPDELKEIVRAGAERARRIAQETMREVRERMGIFRA